ADEQRLRPCARRRQVADVDGGGAVAELAPGKPVEPKVNALDQGVLRDDETWFKLCGVVFDLLGETSALQLGEEPELAELSQPHARARLGRPPRLPTPGRRRRRPPPLRRNGARCWRRLRRSRSPTPRRPRRSG